MIELWAEAGPCENSVQKALDYVDAVYEAGAAALKVQWYNADAIVRPDAFRYDNTSGGPTTQYELFAGSIYPYERWEPVIEKCRSLNVRFIPSVFDLEAVGVANEYDLPVLKIASGDITYHELIREAADGRQVAISTGAATLPEVEAAVDQIQGEHILMACHLEYPTPYHRANLARTYALQANFPHLIPGFSDHTPGIDTVPLIVASGCQVIEKHFTLVPNTGGDSDFALSPTELRNAVLKIEGTVAVMGDSYLEPTSGEEKARDGARRSPYLRVPVPAGKHIGINDLVMLRPFYGIHPWEAPSYVGRSYGMDLGAGDELPRVK